MSEEHARTPRLAVGGVVLEQRLGAPHVVLVRRGKPPRAGSWSLPGGRLEWGESIADGVAREVLEETGLAVRVGGLIEVVELRDESFHYVVLDHRCEVTGGTLRAGDDAMEAKWVAVFDLADYDVTPAVRRVVARAVAGG